MVPVHPVSIRLDKLEPQVIDDEPQKLHNITKLFQLLTLNIEK